MKRSIISAVILASLAVPTISFASDVLGVHVLDHQTGFPAENVEIVLEQKQDSGWKHLNTAKTDHDGHMDNLWPDNLKVEKGIYKVTFKTGDYFTNKALKSYFPEIPVEFCIDDVTQKHFIPLAFSQYGYATYRGS